MSFGGGSINQTEQRVLSLQVSQSAYGAVIPRVWGTVRLPGNLLWYGDFKAIPHTENQGGGKGGGPEFSTTTYTYRAAFVLGLCSGPINGVPRLWADKEQHTLAAKGFTLKTGALGQAPWSHLTANHPTEAIGYSGIAYVCASAFDLGRTTSPPNLTFEIAGERLQAGGDALPRDILSDLLTDPVEGMGWSGARLADLTDYSTWCAAMGIQLSLAADSQRAARDWVTDVLKATMADSVWSAGKLKFVPYGDEPVGAWVPNTTPAYDIDEGDVLEAPRVTVRQRSQAVNRVTVEYCDRAQDYKTVPVTRDDISMVTQFGAKSETHTLHCITNQATAEKVADFWRDRGLYIRADYELKLDERFLFVEPMDLITVTFAPLGLDRVVLRVAEVEEAEDGKITVKAEEWPFGIAKPASIPSEGATGYIPDLNTSPGNSSAPVVFEPPIALAGEPQIWVATSGGVDWGGCEVWVSLDNATYERVGEIQAPARHGLLTSALPAGGDPDTTSTLAVDLSVSRGQLVSASQDARDLWQTACWIASGAGNELVSYQNATLTGPNAYALTSLRRGGYGTQTLAHGSGAKIVRLDDGVFKYSIPTSFIGRTIYIKLPAINRFGGGRQDLSAVSATAYAVVGAPLGGVAGLALERAWTGKQLAVKWLPYQGPAGAYTYRVEVWSGGVKRRTTDIGSAVRFEISQEQLKQDGCSRSVEIRVYAVSDTGVSSAPSVLGATNSAPAAPSIQLFDAGAALTVIASKTTDDDYLETRFWLSQTPGINVSVATPTAILANNQYTTGTIATGTWYVRAAHVDQFGADVLNASAETSVVVSAVASGVPRVANASLITTAANQDPPGGDAYWAVWSIAHGTIWSWNKAGGYYLNNADLANGYYNLLSAVRGTFGYLSAISSSLGNAQIDASGWLRTNGVTGYAGGTDGVFLGYDAGAYKARFGGYQGSGKGGAGWDGSAFKIWGPDGSVVLAAGSSLSLSTLISNSTITIDASGKLQGIGAGSGTSVSNNQIYVSGGSLFGIGSGAGTVVDNNLVRAGGTNLVANTGFQKHDGSLPSGWQIYNNGGVPASSWVLSGGMFGQNRVRLKNLSATSNTFGMVTSIPLGAGVSGWEVGQQYIVSFWVRLEDASVSFQMALASNALYATVEALENPAATASWQRYVFRVRVQSSGDVAGGYLFITWAYGSTLPANTVFEISAIKVELGSTPSAWCPAPAETLNTQLSIQPDGALVGGGGGQVTIGGLGYTGDLNATNGANAGTNLRDSAGNVLSDGLVRNDQQPWAWITGSGKPADGATVGAQIGINLTGAWAQATWDAVMPGALIRSAHIMGLTVDKLLAGNLAVGQTIASTSFSSGSWGWIIRADGTAEFRNVIVRGDIEATSIKAGTVNAIDRLMVKGDAVFVPRFAEITSPFACAGAGNFNVLSVTADTSNLAMVIFFFKGLVATTTGGGWIEIVRDDGFLVHRELVSSSQSFPQHSVQIDPAPLGRATTYYWRWEGKTATATINVTSAQILMMGAR
ncbi:phage tail protein [Niveibacterium sp.]|uniref:phage tail protein n=1 Tax=Niveibacterium sp. TaxID=2017444 RepID=UPI0035AFBE1C